jgi:ATP-dependent exoDNAse (exonuclease V) alpha subunit
VAAASYQAREKIHNERESRTYDYTKKGGLLHSKIQLPENAPPELSDRGILWNTVEKSERRRNARTTMEIILALPRELTMPEWKELVTEYIVENFISQGMVVDFAIHEGDHSDNPHIHILIPTREVQPDGFGAKNRNWNKKECLCLWRENWARAQNRIFMSKGLDARVAHKSYKRRGLDRTPTYHLGPVLSAMERREIKTSLGDVNREIEKRSREHEEQKQREQELQQSRGRERGR